VLIPILTYSDYPDLSFTVFAIRIISSAISTVRWVCEITCSSSGRFASLSRNPQQARYVFPTVSILASPCDSHSVSNFWKISSSQSVSSFGSRSCSMESKSQISQNNIVTSPWSSAMYRAPSFTRSFTNCGSNTPSTFYASAISFSAFLKSVYSFLSAFSSQYPINALVIVMAVINTVMYVTTAIISNASYS
jgi:hypothetical protein